LPDQVCEDLVQSFYNPLTVVCAGGFNKSEWTCYGDSGKKIMININIFINYIFNFKLWN